MSSNSRSLINQQIIPNSARQLIGDFLQQVLLHGLPELPCVANELGAFSSLLNGSFECLLLHCELMIVDLTFVLIFKTDKVYVGLLRFENILLCFLAST